MSAALAEITDRAPAAAPFVPIIDVSDLYGDDPAARAAVAAEIGRACDSTGFFYAVNHHVELATIEAAYAKSMEFFALPVAERMKVKSDRNNRGYREMGDGVHVSGKIFARDSFDLGFPMTAEDPEVVAGVPLYAPNQWPPLEGFEAAVSAYYQGSFEVGMKILEGFALYLGQPIDFFSGKFTRPIADMVINHYYAYPMALGLGAGETASGAHTDHGIITVLWQDNLGGLEVMARDGEWLPVPPIAGSYVINIGELMKRWTNGRFKATIHRVIHTKDGDRISMPLFCNPNHDTLVDPRQLGVDDADARYEPVRSGDFLISRFKATRKLWGAENNDSADTAAIQMVDD